MTEEKESVFLPVKEVARMLRVPVALAQELVDKSLIPTIAVRNRLKVLRGELEEWRLLKKNMSMVKNKLAKMNK